MIVTESYHTAYKKKRNLKFGKRIYIPNVFLFNMNELIKRGFSVAGTQYA